MNRDQLAALVAKADADFKAMSPVQQAAHRRAQRRSYILAEAEFGSDRDEAAYRDAMARNDGPAIERLKAEGKERRRRAEELLDREGL